MQLGHALSGIDVSPQGPVVGGGDTSLLSENLPLSFLKDSGADSFMDESLARQMGFPLVRLTEPKVVLDLDGRTLAEVTHLTNSLTLLLFGNHREQIQLACHNPQIDWATSSLIGWSGTCHSPCFYSALPPAPPSLHSTPVTVDLSAVPEAYHDIREGHFHQVEPSERIPPSAYPTGDLWKTAFNTPLGQPGPKPNSSTHIHCWGCYLADQGAHTRSAAIRARSRTSTSEHPLCS